MSRSRTANQLGVLLVTLAVAWTVAAGCSGAVPQPTQVPTVPASTAATSGSPASATLEPVASSATTATGTAPGSPSGPPAASAFGDDDVAAAVELLAGAGVAVRVRPQDAPIAPPTGASRVALLRFQVRNLALELHGGGGSRGSDLDEVSAANGGLPVSSLIAAWASSAGTPSAATARRLLGDPPTIDDPPGLRIPAIVTTLFLADILAGEAANDRPVVASIQTAAQASGPCDELGAYLSAVLEGILDPAAVVPPAWLRAARPLPGTRG